MTKPIHIEIAYNGYQPQVTAFIENIKTEEIKIEKYGIEVKALVPLNILIEAVSVLMLEQLVFIPLINKGKEWVQAIQKKRGYLPDFNIVIILKEEQTVIEIPIGNNEYLTNKVWQIISDSLKILKKENRLTEIEKIRFIQEDGEIWIVCYQYNRPVMTIDLENKYTISILNAQAKKFMQQTQLENQVRQHIQSNKRYVDFMNEQVKKLAF